MVLLARPLTVTMTAAEPATQSADGTVTVSDVALAAVTEAAVPPTVTPLLPGVALKFVPLIVAGWPGTSGLGEIALIVGTVGVVTET